MVGVSKVLRLGLVWVRIGVRVAITVRVSVRETIMVNATQNHNPNPPNQEHGGSRKLPLPGTSVEKNYAAGTTASNECNQLPLLC